MFQLIAPEILIAATASLLLGFGFSRETNRAPIVRYIAVAALLVFAFMGFITGMPSGEVLNGVLIVDSYAYYAKFVIGISAAAALMFSKSYLVPENLDQYEYSVLVLYAVLGMSIMVSANGLLAVYIGIELQSLALYVLAAFNRDSLRASEAGLKYFVLGALSSGLLLYGITLIYGFTGTLSFNGIADRIASDGLSSGIIAGMVFLLCGLGFNMWTPDVYEGAPTPVTGFFAGAPKFAAIVLIARILIGPFGEIEAQWQQVIIVFAVLSMFVGAFGALRQTNIKRLMAYSSIANMGYAMVPLAAGGEAGIRGMLIFMTIYMITIVGVFACILQMRIRDGMVESLDDLAGLSKTNGSLALILSLFLFSLMGIPPLLGFFGKFAAFYPAFDAGLVWLVVLALIASVVGAFYYLRVIKIMWFDENERNFVQAPRTLQALSGISVLLIIVMILPGIAVPAQEWLGSAAASLF